MNFVQFTAVAAVLGLAACMTDASGGTVVDSLVGKELVAENGTVFIFNADGTVGGTLRGEDVVGTYDATAARVCSTYSSPETLVGQEFCSVPAIDGNSVIFNREDGSQSQLYTIK